MTDTIGLDVTKPTNGTVSATASVGQVVLSWSGFADATSGLASTNTYRVVYARSATAPSNCTAGTLATAGTAASSMTVTGLLDGSLYSFRVCAYDAAGNLSTGATTSETPGDDQTPPTGTVVIAGDATHTGTTSVTLTVAATDDTAVASTCSSNTTTCTTYTTYATTKTQSLAPGSGVKTVYVYFKDTNGNISAAATDTITLDATRPTDVGSLVGVATAGGVDLSWSAATDAGTSVASYRVAYKLGSTAPSSCAAGTGVTLLTGLTDLSTSITGLSAATRYTFRECAVDGVGNVSSGKTVGVTTL